MTASPHSPSLDQQALSTLRKVHAGACVLLIALGGAVLIGWALEIELLKSIGPHFVTMKPNTAFAFVVAGITLWLRRENNDRAHQTQRLTQAGSAIVATIGALTLLEYLTGWNLGIDQLLFHDSEPLLTSYPGRMSANTATAFCLAGASLLLLDTRVAPWLAAAAALPTLLSLIGYIYEAEQFVRPFTLTGAAPHTIAGLLVFSAGLLCARPARGARAWFASPGPQGLLVRQLLPGGINASSRMRP